MLAPIYREYSVSTTIIIQNIATGGVFSFPSVLTPMVTSNNTTHITFTKDEVTWIAATIALTGPIGYFLLPFFMQRFGRRFINICVNFFMFIGTITISFSTDLTGVVIGRALQGIVACQMTIATMLICEYSHPKRRGIINALTFTMISFGILICHGLSAKLNWQQISGFFCVPSALALLSTLTWPESPSWLAYREKYDDCVKAFHCLRDNNINSKKELKEILIAQRLLKSAKNMNSGLLETLKSFFSIDFLKPLLIFIIIEIILTACASLYIASYIIELMIELSGDKSKALYYSLGLDSGRLLATIISIPVIRKFKRKSLLKSIGFVICVLLASVCVFDYLNKCEVLNVKWLPPLLLMLFSIFMHIGILPVVYVIIGEIFPIQFKGLALTMTGLIELLASLIEFKLTYYLVDTLKVYGTFGVYLIFVASGLIILLCIMPETKDRTMQNIENEMVHLKLDIKDDLEVEMTDMLK